MLQMGFGKTAIASAPEVEGGNGLRKSAFNPSTDRVASSKIVYLLAATGGL